VKTQYMTLDAIELELWGLRSSSRFLMEFNTLSSFACLRLHSSLK